MSHASLLVALEPGQFDNSGNGVVLAESIYAAVEEQMRPFDENTANEMFADGTRWDWWVIGGRFGGLLHGTDVLPRKAIDLDAMAVETRAAHAEKWRRAQNETLDIRELIYGVKPNESLDDYLARVNGSPFPGFFGFLRNHVWHEKERMGWWGMGAKTECEVNGNPETRICVFERDGVKIVSWKNYEAWQRLFYHRFIENLNPEAVLVAVDYHV